MHSSSVVGSVVNERGVQVFDGVVGWNSAFDYSVAILTCLRK